MKLGIIGASGQLGRNVLAATLEAGVPPEDLVAITRSPQALQPFAERGVAVRAGDSDDADSLRRALQGVERLLLIPSFALPAARAGQLDRTLIAAQACGVRHVVHYGLHGTHPESPFAMNPYMLFAESALRTSGLEWTLLRNGMYADPIVDWLPEIVAMGTVPYPTGDGRVAYVTRQDLARGGAAALAGAGHTGRIYELTGPRALSNSELCEALSRASGATIVDRGASEDEYRQRCLAEGEPAGLTETLISLYRAVRLGFLDGVSDHLERLTGRRPQSIEDAVRGRKSGGLSEREIQSRLPSVPSWSLRDGALHRELVFVDFVELMSFVDRVAAHAEAAQHHPDLAIHWNRLELTLWTHDVSGLREADFAMARALDALEISFRGQG